MTDRIAVPLEEIEKQSTAALVAHGAVEWIAASVAKAIRKAEATGNIICGLYYLESYCLQLESGRVSGTVEPLVTKPRPGSVHVDAKFGFAQPAFQRGLPMAIAAARENGTASLAIAHSHTCTSLGYFTEQFAEAGILAIGFTNASAVVSPPGGTKAVLGTNPIAMAVPGKTGGIAFQFDQSTSAVALGKITIAKEAGEKIPLGWAIDADGNPTTDPVEALKGSIVPVGGYKGFGFGLMAEVMAAAVTGSVNSVDVKGLKLRDGKPHDLGQYYLLIDPATHGADAFHQRIARLADVMSEQEGTRLPGTRRTQLESVSLDGELWAKVQQLARH